MLHFRRINTNFILKHLYSCDQARKYCNRQRKKINVYSNLFYIKDDLKVLRINIYQQVSDDQSEQSYDELLYLDDNEFYLNTEKITYDNESQKFIIDQTEEDAVEY